MKRVCLFCDRTSSDGNLFCQETYCPAEMCPYILDFGERLGDIEIIRPVAVLRASVLYEAQQDSQRVFLKVAHPGAEHTERLKREAEFLRDVRKQRSRASALPVLLAPYSNTTVAKDPYGKAMLKEHLLYFCLFEYVDGEPLRDLLIKNPQLWIFHVGWIMISLASAVAVLQSKGLHHYGLCPEMILVHFSEDRAAPDVLLFDLGIAADRKQLSTVWYRTFYLPAYVAPEALTNVPAPAYHTDVYGLGMILYEMLVGTPAYPFKLRSDAQVKAAVGANRRTRMTRFEDVQNAADIAITATATDPTKRQKHAAEFTESLLKTFGRPPTQQKRRGARPRTLLIVIAALLAIALIISTGAALTTPPRQTQPAAMIAH